MHVVNRSSFFLLCCSHAPTVFLIDLFLLLFWLQNIQPDIVVMSSHPCELKLWGGLCVEPVIGKVLCQKTVEVEWNNIFWNALSASELRWINAVVTSL